MANFSSSSSTPSCFKTTPDICDDFESTIRVVDSSLGFRNFGGKKHFGGQVVTVKCYEDNSKVKELAKNMDGRNKVMVVDGGGSRRRALLGDMVAADCVQQGWEGLLIYGSIRDVDEISKLDLGVQALGSHPIKTQKRNQGQIGVPVMFGGVTIQPGDYIVCDNNGIVVNESDPREVGNS
jgi:regulator of ribonuclease activity A